MTGSEHRGRFDSVSPDDDVVSAALGATSQLGGDRQNGPPKHDPESASRLASRRVVDEGPWQRRDNADRRASTSQIDLLTIRFLPDFPASSPLELRLFRDVQTAEKRHDSFETALLCL